MFRSSKVVGSVEIAWNDLLASPTLSINRWYPLIPTATISGGSELPAPSLHLAISLKSVVDSVSQQAPQEHDQEAMSCRNEMRRNYMNVNRRIKRLERSDCGCGGKVCCQLTLDEERIFAGLVWWTVVSTISKWSISSVYISQFKYLDIEIYVCTIVLH